MAAVTSTVGCDAALGEPLVEAGALAVALAHGVAAATGSCVLIADADASGARLAGRAAAATNTLMAPAQRGLPTLVAARGGIGAESIERHCWELPTRHAAAGRVLLCAAATHPDGAAHTARWLAGHAAALAALAGAHPRIAAVLVPLSGDLAGPHRALAAAACAHVQAHARHGTLMPGGLRAVLAAFGRRASPDPVTELRASPGADLGAPGAADSGGATRPRCAPLLLGRFGAVRERVLLGARPRRGERPALAAIEAAAARLAAAAGLPATAPAGRAERAR